MRTLYANLNLQQKIWKLDVGNYFQKYTYYQCWTYKNMLLWQKKLTSPFKDTLSPTSPTSYKTLSSTADGELKRHQSVSHDLWGAGRSEWPTKNPPQSRSQPGKTMVHCFLLVCARWPVAALLRFQVDDSHSTRQPIVERTGLGSVKLKTLISSGRFSIRKANDEAKISSGLTSVTALSIFVSKASKRSVNRNAFLSHLLSLIIMSLSVNPSVFRI